MVEAHSDESIHQAAAASSREKLARATLEPNQLFPQTGIAIVLFQMESMLHMSGEELKYVLEPASPDVVKTSYSNMIAGHQKYNIPEVSFDIVQRVMGREIKYSIAHLLFLIHGLKNKAAPTEEKMFEHTETYLSNLISVLEDDEYKEAVSLAKKLLKETINVMRNSRDIATEYRDGISEKYRQGDYTRVDAIQSTPHSQLLAKIAESWRTVLGPDFDPNFLFQIFT